MHAKRIVFIVLGGLLLALLLYFIIRFTRKDESLADAFLPEISLATINLSNLSDEKADITLGLVLDNTSPITLDIDSVSYTVLIDNHEVIKNTYDNAIHVNAGDTAVFSLQLTILYQKLQTVLKRLENEGYDSVNYTVNAVAHIKSKLLPKDKFNLNFEKRLPLIRIPKFKIEHLHAKLEKVTKAVIEVEATIVNPNVFSFGIEDVHYQLQLSDNTVIDGDKEGAIDVPENGSETFTVMVPLDINEIGKSLVDLMREGKHLEFAFDMKGKLLSDEKIVNGAGLKLEAKGDLEDLKTVKKD